MLNGYKDWWEDSLPEGARRVIRWATAAATAILLCLGIYTVGYVKGESKADAKIEKYQKELAQKEAELAKRAGEVSVKVVTEYKDKIQVVKEKEFVYVEKATNDVPTQYELSVGWVQLHDAAARGDDAKTSSYSDGTPSGIADSIALATVVSNYAICHSYRQQLISLQDWVREVAYEVSR